MMSLSLDEPRPIDSRGRASPPGEASSGELQCCNDDIRGEHVRNTQSHKEHCGWSLISTQEIQTRESGTAKAKPPMTTKVAQIKIAKKRV